MTFTALSSFFMSIWRRGVGGRGDERARGGGCVCREERVSLQIEYKFTRGLHMLHGRKEEVIAS